MKKTEYWSKRLVSYTMCSIRPDKQLQGSAIFVSNEYTIIDNELNNKNKTEILGLFYVSSVLKIYFVQAICLNLAN